MSGELGRDRRWLAAAIELSKRCPPVDRAYAVGAVIVGADGRQLAYGYSRETDELVHAEESALAKLAGQRVDLAGATLYSTLEPCSERSSRPRSCTQLILDADARGAELLSAAGVQVVELPDLADAARAVNAHLFL